MKITKNNLQKCLRFTFCSHNICPLDIDANLRNKLPDEDICPFCLKKKTSFQKGIRTLAPDSIIEVIPELNVKLLNKRNQKRWTDLHK